MVATLTLGSCGPSLRSYTPDEPDGMDAPACTGTTRQCVRQLWMGVRALRSALRMEAHANAERQQLIDGLMCPEASVRDWLLRCALNPDGAPCSVELADPELMRDLSRYPNHMLYFPLLSASTNESPDRYRGKIRQMVESMDGRRRSELQGWADSLHIVDRSTILVVWLPHSAPGQASPTQPADEEASYVASDVLNLFMNQVLPSGHDLSETSRVHYLQPREAACYQRRQMLSKYLSRPENRPLGSEPAQGKPRTALWIFHLPCAPQVIAKQRSAS